MGPGSYIRVLSREQAPRSVLVSQRSISNRRIGTYVGGARLVGREPAPYPVRPGRAYRLRCQADSAPSCDVDTEDSP